MGIRTDPDFVFLVRMQILLCGNTAYAVMVCIFLKLPQNAVITRQDQNIIFALDCFHVDGFYSISSVLLQGHSHHMGAALGIGINKYIGLSNH